jgi:hypothetical protein
MTLCISIRQPWVELIFNHGKDIENRDWRTNVRGRILLHAAKTNSKTQIFDALQWCKQAVGVNPEIDPAVISFGCIVGHVDLVDCVEQSESPWFVGRFGFVLRNPVAFARPIPYRGQLGFFDVPDSVLQ